MPSKMIPQMTPKMTPKMNPKMTPKRIPQSLCIYCIYYIYIYIYTWYSHLDCRERVAGGQEHKAPGASAGPPADPHQSYVSKGV